jgi:hypothetical protein
MPTTNSAAIKGVFSLAQAFGGILPRKWGIVVVQASGQTITGLAIRHTPISYTNT